MTAPPPHREPRPPLWTRRVVVVLLAQLTFGLGWSSFLVQPKFLSSALGANPGEMARIAMMSPLAAVAIIPITVTLMDRVSRVWIFRAGLCMLLLAALGYTTITRLTPLLLLLQALVGTSYSLSYNASAAIIADEAPTARLGEAIGLLGASNVVTNAFATALTEYLASHFGWGAAFWTSAGLAIAGLALSTRIEERPLHREGKPPVPILPAVRGPLGRALVCSALMGAAFSAMFTFHQPYVLALGGTSVSPFFVGFTVTAVGMRLFFGSLGDRLGHLRVSLLAMIAYGTVVLATAALHVPYLFAYGLAFGAAHGVLYPTLNTHAVYVSPDGARGRVIALYGGAFNVGVTIATFTWGHIATGFGFPAVFIAAALVAYTGAAVLSRAEPAR